jgi:hypothetical protein
MRSFTRSTLSAMISSSSFGLPSKCIGSPKWMWYLTGRGSIPSGPSHGQKMVMGKAGMPSSRPKPRRFAIAGACSSEPTTAMGTIGLRVSSASRMKPCPNSCSW